MLASMTYMIPRLQLIGRQFLLYTNSANAFEQQQHLHGYLHSCVTSWSEDQTKMLREGPRLLTSETTLMRHITPIKWPK